MMASPVRQRSVDKVVVACVVRGRELRGFTLIGKIYSAGSHQLGEGGLGVSIGADDKDIRFRLKDWSAARRRLGDLLPHLVRFAEFRGRQCVDLNGSLHGVLSLSVG